MSQVILLDLDGVLIRPGGYRAALRETLQTVYRRMRLQDEPPAAAVFDRFEAQGITNEWDMAAFVVALALEQAVEQVRSSGGEPGAKLADGSLDQAFQQVKRWQVGSLEIDYTPLGGLGAYVGRQMTPSAALLADWKRGKAPPLLQHLLGCPRLLEELFANIEDVARSPLSRLHQLYVVGSQEFTRAYQLPAEFACDSYLALHDQPLLSPANRAALLQAWHSGLLQPVVFTARPSLPPRECPDGQPGFTAEAEMAVRLNGLQDLPLIGYGRLRYLGEEIGWSAEHLLKPEPGHALAAILAGLLGEEWPALQAAASILRQGSLPAGLRLPEALTVQVFEDAPIGVRAVRSAVELLRGLGVQTNMHAWGIASHPEKKRALEALGARVYPEINPAISAALEGLT